MQEYKPEPEDPDLVDDDYGYPSKGIVIGISVSLLFWVSVCGIAALIIYGVE